MLKRAFFRLAEASGANRLMRRIHRGRVKVLLYHNVTPGGRHFANSLSPDDFDRHLRWLKRHANIVAMDRQGHLHGLSSDRVNVLLTFDDGFVNNAEHVLPILERHGVSAVFFLIASLLPGGDRPWFAAAQQAKDGAADPYRTLNAEQARRLLAAGITIGSHGFAHDDYRTFATDGAREDGAWARSLLEETLAVPVRCFAFPWGFHRTGQVEELSGVYPRIFTTRPGFADADAAVLPRNAVADFDQLKMAVSGTIDRIVAIRNREDRLPLRHRPQA